MCFQPSGMGMFAALMQSKAKAKTPSPEPEIEVAVTRRIYGFS
jgi:hypothetical protein